MIEGADFEHQVLDSLIEKIADDPWIDPRDDVLGSLRILWHFGCLDRRYYLKRARAILAEKPTKRAIEIVGMFIPSPMDGTLGMARRDRGTGSALN